MIRENESWVTDDDAILAEITLRHIREGSYELKAFSEVAERLGRKAGDCSYRWNSIVRQEYEEAVDLAKTERMQGRRTADILYFRKL